MLLFTALAFLFIIPTTAISISNSSKFGTTNLAYGQPDQTNSEEGLFKLAANAFDEDNKTYAYDKEGDRIEVKNWETAD